MAEFMCQYGNCPETDTHITVSVKDPVLGTRVRFCSFIHLALWAKRLAVQEAASNVRGAATADDWKELRS